MATCDELDRISSDEILHKPIMKEGYDDLTYEQYEDMTVAEEESWTTQEEHDWQDEHKQRMARHLLTCKTERCTIMLKAWKGEPTLAKAIDAECPCGGNSN